MVQSNKTKLLPTGIFVEILGECVRLYSLSEDYLVQTIHAQIPMEKFFIDLYPSGLPPWDQIPWLPNGVPEIDEYVIVVRDTAWDFWITEP